MGTKADLEDERKVTKEEAMQFVKEYEIDYFIEISSKTRMNSEKIFVDAAKLVYKDYLKFISNYKNINKLKIKDENSQNCIGTKKKTIKKSNKSNKALHNKPQKIENSQNNILTKAQDPKPKPVNTIKTINLNENHETINGKWCEYYDWIEIIGNGGFGCVFKAKNKKTNEYRAIKIIKDELKESFINEVNIMEKCCYNNNNSIKIYEKYNSNNEFAIVMELCDCNLKQKLYKSPNGFKTNEIKKILTQLNNTFRIMMENKIIHRDIKLENILVKNENSDYTVKLTDYGVSKQLITLKQECQTGTGTLLIMAPEILQGEKYDNKCDLWSIGVIIYQLCFKEFPYKGENSYALSNKIKNIGQKHFKKTDDPNLDDLIRKLLVANPSKRLSWKEYLEHPFFK